MSTGASAIRTLELGESSSEPTREQLEREARRLPESDLKTAILATLADGEPTVREALAWAAALQAQRRSR